MQRLRGFLWLFAGLIVALLAGLVGYVTLSRAAMRQAGQEVEGVPEVQVVVATREVAVRSILVADDVALKALPVTAVPEGAVARVEDAVGKITLVDLYPGEVILAQRLLDPNLVTAGGRYALLIAGDKVLMALPTTDLMSRIDVLKPGDHVDLLFSLEFPAGAAEKEKQVTFNLLQNLTIAAVVGQPGQAAGAAPQALLLTVSPQDALVLKYALDAGATLDLVLRAPGAEQPFTVEPVDIQYLIDRYRIPMREIPPGGAGE
jgi:pilus assembly protein CpaB